MSQWRDRFNRASLVCWGAMPSEMLRHSLFLGCLSALTGQLGPDAVVASRTSQIRKSPLRNGDTTGSSARSSPSTRPGTFAPICLQKPHVRFP